METTTCKNSDQVVFLKGKRIILRPLDKEKHLELALRWMNDPEIRERTNGQFPLTRFAEEKWFERPREGAPADVIFAIELVETGQAIGFMGLHKINWVDRTAETGTIIGEKSLWGQGYGPEAKLLLLSYAFETLGLEKVNSSVIEYNTPSWRCQLKCGYKEEGRLRSQVFRKGRRWDMILLGVLREEWEPIWRKHQETGELPEMKKN